MSSAELTPPRSYTNISPPFSHITVSHYPADAPAPTPVIIINIDRTGFHNAFTSLMEHDLVRAFNLLDRDERVKAIVVTGKGKNFCAGADLQMGLKRTDGIGSKDHRDGGGRVTLAIHRCRKPTIAAIQGSAIGIGITITLPMVARVAYKNAKIGFVFSQRGVVMEAASSFFLPRLVGHSRAIYLATTGATLPADSPHFGPLFNELLDTSDAVLPRALAIATNLVEQTSTVSTYLMRNMMYRGPASAEEAHLLDSQIMWELYDKDDKIEGVRAFLEKRAPVMKGDLDNGMPGNVPWWTVVDTKPVKGERNQNSKL